MESNVKEVPINIDRKIAPSPDRSQPQSAQSNTGIAYELRLNVERGIPSTLQKVITTIAGENLSTSDYGRLLEYITNVIIAKIYPETNIPIRTTYPTETSLYSKIIRAAANNIYTYPPYSSNDYLEHVLPSLAFFNNTDNISTNTGATIDYKEVIDDLLYAQRANWQGVLSYYFAGIVYLKQAALENNIDDNNIDYKNEALKQFDKAINVSKECYPAYIAKAELLFDSKNPESIDEAVSILTGLQELGYNYDSVKKLLAKIYYFREKYDESLKLVNEVLPGDKNKYAANYYDAYFLAASIFYETKRYREAQNILDKYLAAKNTDIEYSLLRGKILVDGFHNYTDSVIFFDNVLQKYPANIDALVYKAKINLSSFDNSKKMESELIINTLLLKGDAGLEVYQVATDYAIQKSDWQTALKYVDHILELESSERDLNNAYTILKNLNDRNRTLQIARQLIKEYPNNSSSHLKFVEELINASLYTEAGTAIANYLLNETDGSIRSELLYWRSLIRKSDEASLEDLRLSLFENPRNLNSLIASFQIYHNKNETSRARFFFKQIEAISPSCDTVKQYAREYG